MKNGIIKLLVIVALSLNLNSCNNDDDNSQIQKLNGNYTGTFTVAYLNGDTFTNTASVNFSGDNNYESSGNGNNDDFYPAGGKGTYVMNASNIIFTEPNIWLAHFDSHLVLAGEYQYSKNGNELTISAIRPGFGLYKYELIKQ